MIIDDRRPFVLAHFTDTHPNSKTGLFAPPHLKLDDGDYYYPTSAQLKIWDCYLKFWTEVWRVKRELNAYCIAVFGGDGSDDNRHSKYGLVTVNENDMLRISEATFKPPMDVADLLFYVRGTEAHTGGNGWMEEAVARMIGAERDNVTGNYSWYALPLEVNGVGGLFAHHPPSNSTRPWTVPGGAARTAAMLLYDYARTGDKLPSFAVYGHVHHYEDSGDSTGIRVFFNNPWQLTTAFGHRIGYSGRIQPIGGIYFVIYPGGEWYSKKVDFLPKRRAPWTISTLQKMNS